MNGQKSKWQNFRVILFFLGIIVTFVITSCSVLPKAESKFKSPWKTFGQAMASYEKVEPNRTTKKDLKKLGFDPYSSPNVRILSYLDILQKFIPNNAVRREDLPPSVRKCLEGRETCVAYEATPGENKKKRVGNVVLDLLSFKRRTLETGWNFKALIVIDHDIVVYKIWSGVPIIDQEKIRKNPLGPLQGSGGSLVKEAVGL